MTAWGSTSFCLNEDCDRKIPYPYVCLYFYLHSFLWCEKFISFFSSGTGRPGRRTTTRHGGPGKPGSGDRYLGETKQHVVSGGNCQDHFCRFTLLCLPFCPEISLVYSQVKASQYWLYNSCYLCILRCWCCIAENVFFNGPRAAVNFNDGFGGGDLVERNLLANCVSSFLATIQFNFWF